MNLNPEPLHHLELESTRGKRSLWADVMVFLALVAVLFSLLEVGQQWHHSYQQQVEINLSPWWLPYYTLLSFFRGVIAYVLSLIFTLLYARWAAYDRQAEQVLIPILDVLQSIPFPAFLLPMEALLISAFPSSNIGLELTCVFVIFTGQVWNMTFSFYYSLKNLPPDFTFVGKLAQFTPWQHFTQIEVPFSTSGLVYNSMVSMAGGWFFLTVTESFQIGDKNFRLPGIGSYMAVAQEKHDAWAQLYAVIAMIMMIVILDQLVWRPLIIWSTKFKLEDTEAQFQEKSSVLRWLKRSKLAGRLHDLFRNRLRRPIPRAVAQFTARRASAVKRNPSPLWKEIQEYFQKIPLSWIFLVLFAPLIVLGAINLVLLLLKVSGVEWLKILGHLFLTLIRVLAALALSTLWTIPVGVWIGSNPRLARYFMPITQIAASFPSPMIFGNLIFLILLVGGNSQSSLEWGAVLLMMLGTQWYLLFNIISGASAVPQDLRACTELMHLTRWQQWRTLWLPGIFPALVTGWITAAGGAWNASIVSEYIDNYGDKTLQATGLGAMISQALKDDNTPMLAASVLVMAFFVIIFNRSVWKQLANLARRRYQILN